jgi:TldD protein
MRVMKGFALSVIDLLDRTGVEYADVRIIRRRHEGFHVKNGVLEAWSDDEETGFGVRILAGGYWGFAAANDVSAEQAARTVSRALQVASASASVGGPRARLAQLRPRIASHASPFLEDPFSVSAEDKIALLLATIDGLVKPGGVAIAQAQLGALREEKVFASTEGALIDQTFVETGAGVSVTAIRDGDVQTRSYPSAGLGSWSQQGFEYVRALDLAARAPRLAEEVVALLDAPTCSAELATVILDAEQMALQVHESVGHPTELDRILGSEASYAGTSFVTPADVGHLAYGSEHVNVVADATVPTGLGTSAFDDEGVPAQRAPLVHNGVLVGLQTSRETAALVGREPTGAMRASGWNRIPLIRMTNVNLVPGEWRLEDLIADTPHGYLLSTNKSWSIDDRRLNFQFATEIGWEIKNGRLGRMLRDCTYTGSTPAFWKSCDAVCNRNHWELFGVTNCGKGEPGQTVHVSHGVSPARFRDVRLGTS